MPRQKCKRMTSFQPYCQRFSPQTTEIFEEVSLLAEEVEALYWMDLQGVYQEKAALKMEVSRPTLARIIKSARHKIALALLSGRGLHLESSSDTLTIALCSDSDQSPYIKLYPKASYVHFFTLSKGEITHHECLKNPSYGEFALKPLQGLVPLLIEKRVNRFITYTMGEGLKEALRGKGIRIDFYENLIQEDLVNLVF